MRRSRPAITRALASLEERIGARLIARSTRQLTPTDAGRELAASARRMLAEYEAVLSGASAIPVRGLLSFYAEHTDYVIDGERIPRPVTEWSRSRT